MFVQLTEAFTLLSQKISTWLNGFVLLLPNIVLAILIMALVALSTNYVKKLTKKTLARFSSNESVNNLFSSITVVTFFGLGLFLSLNILHLEKTVTSLLAGAGVLGLAVGLAFQDPLINTISGIIMSFKKPYRIGDLVETNNYQGYITDINLRFTYLRTFDGQKIVIPNKLVIQNPLTNYSITNERRVVLECGISYAEDLEKVRTLAIEAIEEKVPYDSDKPIDFFYTEFGDSSINFRIHIWMDLYKQSNFLQIRSEAVIALKQAFDQNGITIPFPIRTLDFGIKGGEKLSKMLVHSSYEASGVRHN